MYQCAHFLEIFLISPCSLYWCCDRILEQTEWNNTCCKTEYIYFKGLVCLICFFVFFICTWKAIWCECNKELDLLPDNSTLTANSTSIQHYCELTDMAWIELRIAEAIYLAVNLIQRKSDAPAVMHMLHCTWKRWKIHISHAKHMNASTQTLQLFY